jgi:ABC-type uncharacterized transport system auxiliary subunit
MRPGRAIAAVPAALGICLGAAGCSGSLFQSRTPPPATYLLSADLGTAAPAVPLGPRNLAVLRPRVRIGLDSDRIAALYPDRRLDYFADARWSGPLDQVVQDLAIQAFRTGGGLRNVSAESSAFPSGYWLEILVTDFQAEYPDAASAPTVHVRLSARLGAAGDRRVLGSFDAGSRQAAAQNRMPEIVAAYERAVDAALAALVADATGALAGDSGR